MTQYIFFAMFVDKTQQVPVSFESVLLSSMCREQSMQAWCQQCSRYQPTVSVIKVTPPVFMRDKRSQLSSRGGEGRGGVGSYTGRGGERRGGELYGKATEWATFQ